MYQAFATTDILVSLLWHQLKRGAVFDVLNIMGVLDAGSFWEHA